MPIPNVSAIQTPIFQAARRTISAITNAYPCVITTTFDHNYRNGDIIRIVMPYIQYTPNTPYGFNMTEINNQFGVATIIDSTNFSLPIDTTLYGLFITYVSQGQVAQTVPIGESNSTILGATQNTLPTLVRPFSPS